MGYAGKLKERSLAIAFRQKGLSVRTIQQLLKVSKSSVSIWTREIQLTKRQKRKLYLNERTGQLRGSIVAAENKKRRRKLEEKRLLKLGRTEIGRMKKRDRFVTGVAMYFAEGDKRGVTVGFSNTDPRAIRFMVRWFREFLRPPEHKFRVYLYIHDNLDVLGAKKFWAKLTKIPLNQFGKTYIVRNDKNRLRTVAHPYGVARICVSNVRLLRRLKGWIAGVIGKERNYSRVAQW